ncbi:MAG: response regulator transcription factor [Dehalococcoidia bacterium]
MKRIRVLVVDDHAMVRRGVVEALSEQEEVEVVGEAEDGAGGLEKVRSLTPDVVIMDLQMPGVGGLEATSALHTELPDVQVLVFTVSEREEDLFAAMRCGAKGYILKNARADELLRAILHISQGGVIVSPAMASKLLDELAQIPTPGQQPGNSLEGLSPREVEVLQLVAEGASNNDIASSLIISENTVKTHLRNIMDKLHLANRSQAAAYAVRAGLQRPQGAGPNS